MRIDIVGAGSLGKLFAARLAASGTEVRLWCRTREQSDTLNRDGLLLYEPGRPEPVRPENGRLQAYPIEEFAARLSGGSPDWILLAVKQNVLHRDLAEPLSQLRGNGVRVVCLQNGGGHLAMLRERLPDARLYAAVTTEGATGRSLREVTHAGKGETWIGEYDGGSGADHSEDAIPLQKVLEAAGFTTGLSNEVDTLIYRKMLVNAVINPLTAIWRVRNGELLDSEARLDAMRLLCDESVRILASCGIDAGNDAWERIVAVCRSTSDNTSSMLADVLAGRETEVRWINGHLAALAESSGTEAPLNRMATRLVEGMIAKER
ncbi:2-dehydropantoate 2-reductase [Paenibacillus spiritus]|uniref:2-dehydropantoate 2-reductase n=1 Tax=Paenibacillus spiritus TaxID=2496557 RepID=A0A5J5GHB8_9BACL|nr:2-dehydropantoate 2-reductase [Paenibacillus spiritus]KAA9007616.1 2-dehydropantoate 2-reductase [Paenibacillus spiritus]